MFPKHKYEKLYSERDKKILELYDSGLNTMQIEKELGIRNNTIGRVLKRHNIKPQGRQLTPEQLNEIKSLHLLGWHTVEIANKLGISDSAVGRNLNRMEITDRHYGKKLSPQKEEEVLALYLKGLTTKVIGDMFKVDANTVANIVRRHGFTLRQGGYIPALKFTDFFKIIDTEEKAYFLGLMITDGSVVIQENRNPCIGIMLKKEDKHIVDLFAEILGFESDRVKISNRDEVYFRFHSKEMADDLAKFGVIPTKTFTTYIPIIAGYLMPHLIRGCFDGDGSVFVRTTKEGRNSLRVAFYGTYLACEQFQGHLIYKLNISKTKVYSQKSHNVSFTSINRKKDILAFYNYIYKDAKIYLIRKKEIFDNNLDLLEYYNEKTRS
ncbi:helix-turn-helix domain-containing protein [Bacillus wiedmannii]|uniref:DOD-type homing endonuclease domain-containing protein n=1 Tax=Bacillus wiedmannii TaxID=1890302 RepID=A0A2C4HNM2_9BACI|nr:helix-turn-helix domain-containing protein [Bacillus wiedmannii]PEJ06802.1 hypothetical protein CN684_17720 [Bacillus wiedmannii]PHC68312.1 hypothetical protein COF35_10745 [Bacillus wiedmannii]